MEFKTTTLKNGLQVVFHQDLSSSLVTFNLMYNVGARDESPERTGFAHLFEHLMFGGTPEVPNYDDVVERVGGQNNAFTSNDVTNYYITLPKDHVETAFYLESDRMRGLAFTPKSLEVQRQVVIEEFKQRYLNQPYGDVYLLLRDLSYQVHPYRWATIGKEIKHIEEASMEEVKSFFYKHYAPNNAVLTLVGNMQWDEVLHWSEKYFGNIPKRDVESRNLPAEPLQGSPKRLVVERPVPLDALYMTFHMVERGHPDYFATDLISDILSRGESSRFVQSLVKEKELFVELNAYIGGDMDPGLFYIAGKPNEGVSLEEAEAAVWKELKRLTEEEIDGEELDKVKNKAEAVHEFSLLSGMNKAIGLAYATLMGNPDLVNQEMAGYRAVKAQDILRIAKHIFTPDNSHVMWYKAENKS